MSCPSRDGMVTGVRVVPQNEKLKQCERSQQVTFNTTQSQGPGPLLASTSVSKRKGSHLPCGAA